MVNPNTIPERGDVVAVHGKAGLERHKVQTIDMAGYPVIGEARHNDSETNAVYRDLIVKRHALGERAAVLLAMDDELTNMLDMGGVGASTVRA